METNVGSSLADGLQGSLVKDQAVTTNETEKPNAGVENPPNAAVLPENFGQYLRRLRESRDLSLDQIFALTKIAPRMLSALEENRSKDLPSKPFIRGFLRALSRPLRVPADELIAHFESSSVQAANLAAATQKKSQLKPSGLPPGLRRWEEWIERKTAEGQGGLWRVLPRSLAGWAVMIAILLLACLAGFFIFGRITPITSKVQAPEQVQSQVASQLEHISTPNQKPTQMDAAKPEPVAPKLPESLVMEAKKDTWLKLAIDRKASSEVFLKSGEKREFRAAQSFDLLLGNAGGVVLTYNGKTMDRLGAEGAIKRVILPPPRPAAVAVTKPAEVVAVQSKTIEPVRPVAPADTQGAASTEN